MRAQRRPRQARGGEVKENELAAPVATHKAVVGPTACSPQRGRRAESGEGSPGLRSVPAPAAALAAEAQVALLQLAGLAVGGPESHGAGSVEEGACHQVPLWQRGHAGQHPAALPPGRQPCWPPASAPTTMRTRSEEAEVAWLEAMQLSPLVDLRSLRQDLEAPSFGWPQATAIPAADSAERNSGSEGGSGAASEQPTPAALVHISLGTPFSASQTKGLPHPSAIDFGAFTTAGG